MSEYPLTDALKEEFQRRLAHVVWEDGMAVRESDTFYGWPDYDVTTHARDCKLKSWSQMEEVDWYQFTDTFNDPAHNYGIEMLATCECGTITNWPWRLDETFGQVLRRVVGVDL